MAIIHQATLTPTKAELIARWLPVQEWFARPVQAVTPVAAYRFDDPAGEVGIESLLLDVDGLTVHVPVTSRSAPFAEAEDWLVGTLEHSVLGTRWVYDGLADPVYRAEVVRVIEAGDTNVDLFVVTPDGTQRREPPMRVHGGGGAAPAGAEIVVVPFPGKNWPVTRLATVAGPATTGSSTAAGPATAVLTGTWPGQDAGVVLVYLR
jgi:hypothetical protein